MKRKIVFRGKSLNGEWLHGDLIHQDGEVYVAPVDVRYPAGTSFKQFAVDPDTIGQYTGLKDKNGVEIYEGEIIAVERVLNFQTEYAHHLAIEWVDYGNGMVGWTQFSPRNRFVVVGNIHDNPELLKGGED